MITFETCIVVGIGLHEYVGMGCEPSSSFGYYQGEEQTIYGLLALIFNNLKSYGQVIVKRGYLLRL